MRLVCPKCAVQYEVGENAIPENGRDVQCSACGHGWFQPHDSVRLQKTLVAELTPPPLTPPALTGGPGGMPPAPQRKPLDEKVMAILREEALREAAARRGDPARMAAPAPPPEPPRPAPEVTLIQPPPIQPPPLVPPGAPRTVARRGLLPDIEEINSTLTAGSRRRGPEPAPPPDPHPGFRAGFGLMMVLVAMAAAAYVQAPRLSAAVPQAAGVMDAYVGGVDHLRRQLDATVTAARQRIDALLGPAE